ncbi:Annexin, partial [Coprinellus micaceus]
WYLGIQIPDPNLPRVSMNRLKYPPYDPKVDWEKIEATIEQKPAQYTSYDVADPLRVGRVLLTSTTFQRDALNDYAINATGKDLYHWLEKYPAARGVETMRGFALGPLAYDIWLIDWSIKGGLGGHDAIALVEVVCDSDHDDLRLLMAQYKTTHNVELVDAIRKKYSGRKLERLLLSCLSLERPSDSLPVQATQVATDADALWDATRRRPRDEAITDVFTKRSRPHVAAVISLYSTRHGSSLRQDIKKVLKGSDYGHAILYILDGVKAKRDGHGAWRDAKMIMATMKGVGMKHTELQYRVVRAQWDKERFVAVRKAFKEHYGMTFEERIAEATSSYYKNIFFMMCQQTLDLEGGAEV